MTTKPYPFQQEGYEMLERFGGRALLADSMGLGKSLQTLLYLQAHPELHPAIIVCPANIKINWEREVRKHINREALVLEGRRVVKTRKKYPIYIINYDILSPWMEYLLSLKPGVLVFDEAHYCCNQKAQRTRNVRKLSKKIPHVIAVSGTPLTSRPAQLYPILNIVRPDLYPSFFSFATKFCLPPDAPILMGNLTEKPISEVEIGDEVIGWERKDGRQRRLTITKVVDTLQKMAPLQKITLDSGKVLISTPDHLWATGSSIEEYEYHTISTKPNKNPTGRPFIPRVMEVFRGTKPIYKENKDYQLGYIQGAWMGDGFCIKETRKKFHLFKNKTITQATKLSVGFGCKDESILIRLQQYLTTFDQSCDYRLSNDGLYRMLNTHNREMYELLSRDKKNTNEWWAGFLGGIYDTEGSGRTIAQHKEVNPITYNLIRQALNRFGFSYTEHPKSIWWLGGRSEMLRFWNIANPVLRRKLVKFIMSAGGKFNAGGVGISSKASNVVSIELLPGTHKVYTLTTETGNYIAYGHGSKNCRLKRTPWGMDYSGAKNLPELHRNLSKQLMIRRTKEEVLKDLPPKTRSVLPIPIKDKKDYLRAERDFFSWLKENKPESFDNSKVRMGGIEQIGHLKRLAAYNKLPSVMEWVDNFLEDSDEKLLLFCIHKRVASELMERYGNCAVLVTGKVTRRRRQQAFDSFNEDPNTRLLIGNMVAAGVGWSSSASANVAFCELPWTPGELEQCEDRCHGIGRGVEGRVTSCFYLVGQDTIEEDILSTLQKKQEILSNTLDGGSRENDLDVYDLLLQKLREKGKR